MFQCRAEEENSDNKASTKLQRIALGACKITNSLIFWLSSIFTSYYLTPGLVCLNLSMGEWMEMANCHREAAERRAGKRNRVEEGHSGEWIYQREGMEEGWAGGWFQ